MTEKAELLSLKKRFSDTPQFKRGAATARTAARSKINLRSFIIAVLIFLRKSSRTRAFLLKDGASNALLLGSEILADFQRIMKLGLPPRKIWL